MVQDGTGGASSVRDAAEQKIYAVRRGRSAQSMATSASFCRAFSTI